MGRSGRWLVEGFVMNVTDDTYVASQIFNASSNDGGTIYGAPRQYGVRRHGSPQRRFRMDLYAHFAYRNGHAGRDAATPR